MPSRTRPAGRKRQEAPHRRAARAAAAAVAALLLGAVPHLAGGRPGVSAAVAVNLSNSPVTSANPAVAASRDRVVVVWEEAGYLRHAVRTDHGWSAAAPVPAAAGSSPRLAAESDGVFHLVWSSFNELGGSFDILHSAYAEGAWQLPVLVAETDGDSIVPDIGVAPDGSRLVAWIEVEAGPGGAIYVASAAGDGDWTYGPLDDAAATALSLARGPDGWHLAWAEDMDGDGLGDALYRARQAEAWALPEVVYMGGASVGAPSLTFDGQGRPAIAWSSGAGTVHVAVLVDGVWSEPLRLDGGQGASGRAVTARADSALAVAWARDSDVLLTRQTPGGWSAPATAMRFGGRARGAAMAVSAGGPAIVAEGQEADGPSDVYFVEPGASPPTTDTPGTPSSPTAEATPEQLSPTPVASPHPDTPTPEPTSGPTAWTATATAPVTPTVTEAPHGPARIALPIAYRGRR